ncbi:MAG: PIN domain-containing protein [Pseudonocardia sp.]|nr:PIN domain-containing protein [Pseudonocardia sp.]
MILPDVNVLVYAHRQDSVHHERYGSWLAEVVAGRDELALVEATLTGFVRIVTHPRIFDEPATTTEALAFVETLHAARRVRRLVATAATWRHFAGLANTDRQVRGNLVPDAWLAAMARSHGCRVATADRGFARYPGVDWFDPSRHS